MRLFFPNNFEYWLLFWGTVYSNFYYNFPFYYIEIGNTKYLRIKCDALYFSGGGVGQTCCVSTCSHAYSVYSWQLGL